MRPIPHALSLFTLRRPVARTARSGGSNRHGGSVPALAWMLSSVVSACTLSFPYPDDTHRPDDAGGGDARHAGDAGDASVEDPCTVALADARHTAAPPPGSGPLPPKNAPFRAAQFGTCVRRVTDDVFTDPRSLGELANADRTWMIVNDDHHESWVYDLATGERTTYFAGLVASQPTWHDAHAARVTRLSTDAPYAITDLDLVAGAPDPVASFDLAADLAPVAADVRAVGSNDFGAWWSADRLRAVVAIHGTGSDGAIATYERTGSTFARIGFRSQPALVDWVRIAPTGNYVVACWTGVGMLAHPTDLETSVEIAPGERRCFDQHALVRLRDDHDAFVYATETSFRAVDLDRLMAGETDAARYLLDAGFGHSPGMIEQVELAAPARKRGWVAMLFRGCSDPMSATCPPGDGWGQDKIVAFEVPTAGATQQGRALALAWHASTRTRMIAVDAEFRYVYFASTWGDAATQSIFEIDLGRSVPE